MRFITSILFIFLFSKINAQNISKCNCGALIDIDYKSKISILEKPNGLKIRRMSHNLKNDNYLVLNIYKDTVDYFYVKISYSLSDKKGLKGWIKKNKSIGVFAKNYSGIEKLNLYSKPNLKSKIKSSIPEWINQIYTIEQCSGKWAYVKIKYKGKLREGWLQPDKQCDNPYTTCN